MASNAVGAAALGALSDRAQRLPGHRAPQAGRRRLLRQGGRPVRRDDRAVRAPSAGNERLGAHLRLRPALQAQASARRAEALPAASKGHPRLVDAAARRGCILLLAGARNRSLVVGFSVIPKADFQSRKRDERRAVSILLL